MKFYSRHKYKNLFLPILLFVLYFGLLKIAGFSLNNFFSPWSTAIILSPLRQNLLKGILPAEASVREIYNIYTAEFSIKTAESPPGDSAATR